MQTSIVIPEGTPAWISEELIQVTLRVWQPYYSVHLSVEDAIAMIRNVGHLFDVLSRGNRHETLCGTGTGEQGK